MEMIKEKHDRFFHRNGSIRLRLLLRNVNKYGKKHFNLQTEEDVGNFKFIV